MYNEEKLDKLCNLAVIRQNLKEVLAIYGDLVEDYSLLYPDDSVDYMSSVKEFYNRIELIIHESVENYSIK